MKKFVLPRYFRTKDIRLENVARKLDSIRRYDSKKFSFCRETIRNFLMTWKLRRFTGKAFIEVRCVDEAYDRTESLVRLKPRCFKTTKVVVST